jgi:hypothetical protein
MSKKRVIVATLLALVSFNADADAQEAEASGEVSVEPSIESVEGEAVEPAGVNLSIGPHVISRSMQFRLGDNAVDHSPGVYIGGMARISVEAYDFDSLDAKLLINAEGGYAGTKNSKVAAELNRQPVTEWSQFAARATVRRPLTDALDLDVGLGAVANSFIVEPNLTYTGHRYIAAEFRVGLDWAKPAGSWALGADASAYPALAVNQSSGAYGDSSAFGARAGAQVGYNVFAVSSTDEYAGGRVLLRYDFTRFRSQFPQGRVAIGGGVSEDDMHALTLMFGYFM